MHQTVLTFVEFGHIRRFAMATNPSNYQPISCAFHDLLEAHATARKLVQVRFRDGDGAVQACSAVISDLFAREGVEYLSMSTGDTLRLDQLIEVDGARLADY